MHGTVAHYVSMAKAVQCCTGVERLQYTLRRKSKCLEWHSALNKGTSRTRRAQRRTAASASADRYFQSALVRVCLRVRGTPVPSKTVIAASRAFNRTIAVVYGLETRRMIMRMITSRA